MRSTGSTTLFVLVLLLVTILILASLANLISRQSNAITDQEQEEQAFGAADAGVEYVKWLLTTGVNVTDIVTWANPSSSEHAAKLQRTLSAGSDAISTFDVVQAKDNSSGGLSIRVHGQDSTRLDICQVIDATLCPSSGGWATTQWQHYVTRNCSNAPAPQFLTCSGSVIASSSTVTPTPTPTPTPVIITASTPTPAPTLCTSTTDEHGFTGLVHRWPLDTPPSAGGPDSLLWPDVVNRHDLGLAGDTSVGQPYPLYDASIKGLRFDGWDDQLKSNIPCGNLISQRFTISFWLKNEDLVGARGILTTVADQTTFSAVNPNSAGWLLNIGPVGLEFSTAPRSSPSSGPISSAYVIVPAGVVLPNQIAHLTITADGSRLRAYVNGTEVAVGPTYSTIFHSGASLLVGDYYHNCLPTNCGFNNFLGSIADIRIYNRALSASDISTLAIR
jgi:hypothetical protein